MDFLEATIALNQKREQEHANQCEKLRKLNEEARAEMKRYKQEALERQKGISPAEDK